MKEVWEEILSGLTVKTKIITLLFFVILIAIAVLFINMLDGEKENRKPFHNTSSGNSLNFKTFKTNFTS